MRQALVFPGQGSQEVGMGMALHEAHQTHTQAIYDIANGALGYDLQKLIFNGPAEELTLTQNAQPAILLDSIIKYELIRDRLSDVVVAAGHSLGEFSALVAAGVLKLGDALQLVHKRGLYMQDAVPVGEGSMVAVLKLDLEIVEKICSETGAEIANFNSPGQIVLSGAKAKVDAAKAAAVEAGGRGIELDVSAPFHSSLMQPAEDRLAAEIDTVQFHRPSFPVISTVSGKPESDEADIKSLLRRQITAQVRWPDYVGVMREIGAEQLIEIGPGEVLTRLNQRIDRTLDALSFEKAWSD